MIVKRLCNDECYLTRYCDEFVRCVQNEYEAKVALVLFYIKEMYTGEKSNIDKFRNEFQYYEYIIDESVTILKF